MPTVAADPPAAPPAVPSSGRRPLVWVLWVGIVVVAAVGVVALAALPTRAWLDQRSQIEQQRQRVDALAAENQKLADQVTALQTPAEIDRLARERYGLVRPGEHSFAILPSGTPPLPAGWPYPLVQQILTARGITLGP